MEIAPLICVREAKPSDAADVARILGDAFEEHRMQYTEEAYLATVLTREQIVERLSEGPTWLAMKDGAAVGTVSAVARGDSLHVRSMGVSPASRGLRIAWKLLDHLQAFAREGGWRRMQLNTTPFLISAIRLYERYGFRRITDGPHDLHGTPLFSMEKVLTSPDAD